MMSCVRDWKYDQYEMLPIIQNIMYHTITRLELNPLALTLFDKGIRKGKKNV